MLYIIFKFLVLIYSIISWPLGTYFCLRFWKNVLYEMELSGTKYSKLYFWIALSPLSSILFYVDLIGIGVFLLYNKMKVFYFQYIVCLKLETPEEKSEEVKNAVNAIK